MTNTYSRGNYYVLYPAPATGTRSGQIVHRQPTINNKLALPKLTPIIIIIIIVHRVQYKQPNNSA